MIERRALTMGWGVPIRTYEEVGANLGWPEGRRRKAQEPHKPPDMNRAEEPAAVA
jgi:hypothetical protein